LPCSGRSNEKVLEFSGNTLDIDMPPQVDPKMEKLPPLLSPNRNLVAFKTMKSDLTVAQQIFTDGVHCGTT
jgi:hypothetical protein